jgi:zinc protease
MQITFRHFLSLTLCICGFTALYAQPRLIEKVERKGDEIVIPYSRYELPNGLTILIHEDNSDPMVHVDVTYHVGSAREELGRSGFAHFFEHMMFQGSDNVADEEHFSTVTEAGGTLNGTTNLDRTNYFETLPANQLEVALWLEADRMGFLLDAVTQQKFEIQRATVKNERGQNYDNRPYGLVNEKTIEALYPVGHPYSWPTIGYLIDLDRVNVDDLKRFFMRWYGPNNAVLTVAGDVKTEEVLKMAEKYFGSIPRGPEVKAAPKMPVTLDADRYISYEDNIRFPMLQFAFPGVPSGHPDEAPLDLLAEILGGDNTSILYQDLVKTQIAVQARAMNPAFELAGMFQINVLPFPGKNLAEMEKLIREAIAKFEQRGVTNDDLIRFKNTRESSTISQLASISGKASRLASFYTFFGDANRIGKELEMVKNITAADVMRVYNQYIKNKPAVILSVYPKGQKEVIAREDNYFPKKSWEMPAGEGAEYKNLSFTKAKDNFDRSKKPQPGPSPVINVPAYYTETFNNGIKLIGTEDFDLPMFSLVLSFPAGQVAETPEKAGLASITASMLGESTMGYSAEAMTEALGKLGSDISVSSDREYIYFNVSGLKKNLDQTLRLLEERIFRPKFDTADFSNVKSQQLAAITNSTTRATAIADKVYNKLLYGNHIMSQPEMGTKESVERITIDDVRAFYNAYIQPGQAKVVMVGAVKQPEVTRALGFLAAWNGKAAPELAAQPAKPVIEKTKIYFVNKDKAPQSEIRIGYLAMPYDATGEFYRSGIMNYVLGGNFNSRINITLREKKGYTYGARSGFNGSKYIGPFTASAGVKAEKTDSSLMDFFSEINLFRDKGITTDELSFTKSSLGQRDALKYETPFQKALFLQRILEYNLDRSFTNTQNEILKSITANDINGLAKRHLPTDKMIVVVVGDKATNFDKVKALGYEVVELDIDGNPVK